MEEKEEKTQENAEKTTENTEKSCPSCGSTSVQLAGRCATCMECGWSVCSI